MRQQRNVVCLGLLFLLIWGMTLLPARGGDGPGKDAANWDKVKQIMAGRQVLVVQKEAKSSEGKLQSVNDESIVIHLATGEQTIPKNSIVRVSTRGASHRWRNLGLGAGIGLGAGAGIGAAAGNPNLIGGRGIPAAAGGVIGLAIGAAVGAALPASGWHEIYRAQ